MPPRSGNSVKRKGSRCPTGSKRDTRKDCKVPPRCRKPSARKTSAKKSSNVGKVLNPKTGRWVKRDGKIGKEILAARAKKASASKKVPRKPAAKKALTSNYFESQATGRAGTDVYSYFVKGDKKGVVTAYRHEFKYSPTTGKYIRPNMLIGGERFKKNRGDTGYGKLGADGKFRFPLNQRYNIYLSSDTTKISTRLDPTY